MLLLWATSSQLLDFLTSEGMPLSLAAHGGVFDDQDNSLLTRATGSRCRVSFCAVPRWICQLQSAHRSELNHLGKSAAVQSSSELAVVALLS